MVEYENWMMVLMVLPDSALRHAFSALFLTFQQIRSGLGTGKYIGSSDELDLMRYFLYMTFVAVFAMVSL